MDFEYDVRIKVDFSGAELYTLWQCSRAHYDGTCQAASDPETAYPEAFLTRGINYSVNTGKTVDAKGRRLEGWKEKDLPKMKAVQIALSVREIAICCKCLEQMKYVLTKATLQDLSLEWKLRGYQDRLHAEYERLDPEKYGSPR